MQRAVRQGRVDNVIVTILLTMYQHGQKHIRDLNKQF